MLDALRELGAGRYAAVFDAKAVRRPRAPTRRAKASGRCAACCSRTRKRVLRLPGALHAGDEMGDPFAELDERRVPLSPREREGGRRSSPARTRRGSRPTPRRLLHALVDRLLRLDPAWRVDEKGRGLFFGSPRLDTVVIPRPATAWLTGGAVAG